MTPELFFFAALIFILIVLAIWLNYRLKKFQTEIKPDDNLLKGDR